MSRWLMGMVIMSLTGATGCMATNYAEEPEPAPVTSWMPQMQTVADGANGFALDMYGELQQQPGNMFFSPYSIHTALAMTADGANGATRDEMVKTLHLPADREAARFAGEMGRYYVGAGKPYELTVANSLWGQVSYPWRPDFLNRQRERFGAKLSELDFKSDPEASRKTINAWVEKKTRDRIQNLLQPDNITPLTKLVLVNAIYFKGLWNDEFKKTATQDAPFTLADGQKKTMPLMNRTGSYRYAESEGMQILEMPYKGNELSMIVLLPEKNDGLPAIEAKLNEKEFKIWTDRLRKETVVVTLPRFKLEQTLNPVSALKKLGMVQAFDERSADFSEMTSDPQGLFISAIAHKAFVEVNESGTEAAAATAVVMAPASAVGGQRPPPPKIFRADRPFVFMIRDMKHGTILFLGRYTGM